MDKTIKEELITNYALHKGDTGSADVQIALLTTRINELTGHMAANRNDHNSQRGLLKLVGARRRLLAYLSKEDVGRYRTVIKNLGLRK